MTKTAAKPRVITRMAMDRPLSWDEKTRTFDLVISTESDVGDGVIIVHDDSALRFPTRPIPLGIDHSYSSKDVWGSITEIRFDAIDGVKALVGRGKVDDEDTDAVRVALPRLRDGSARFSVGARAFAVEEVRRGDEWEVLAIDWEILETSLVVAGQDTATIMRTSVTQASRPSTMDDDDLTPSAEGTAPAAESGAPTVTPDPAPAAPIERSAAAAPSAPAPDPSIERSAAAIRRERDILRSCVQAGIPADKADAMVASGKSHQECLTEIFTLMRGQLSQSPAGHPVGLQVTGDQGDMITRSISDALSFRLHTIKEPTEQGRRFYRKRSLDMLEAFLISRGVNTDHLSQNQVIARAFHSTSDFPLLLADVANKRLLEGYEEEPQTWKPFASQRNLTDFKPTNSLQIDGRLTLSKSLENGEYKAMTLEEGKATWRLATYRGKLLWTREMIINDDLNAFEKVIMMAGRGARTTESDIIWGLLTTGAITGGQTYGGGAIAGIDGLALFAQGHSNTGSGVINIANVDAGRVLMAKQKSIAGNELNLTPKYVLVPTSLATLAEQFFYAPSYYPADATGNAGPNVFSQKMQIIVENRLETRSSVNWFMAADPSRVEMIEYGYLSGEEGPNITVTDRRDPDGAEMLVRLDFGAAVQDYRGFYRSTGA